MKRHKTICTLLIFFFVMTVSTVFAQTSSVLTRNLGIGSRGEDVRVLQQLLNQDSQTQLAFSGVGSLGQETNYYGALTQNAVVRFQELYSSEILTPLGLSKGTGFFGFSTRRKIQEIAGTTGLPTPPTDVAPIFGGSLFRELDIGAVPPHITSVSPGRGGVGTEVTIIGENFSFTGNRVSTIFEQFDEVSSTDGITLVVKLKGPFPEEFLEDNKEFYERFEVEVPYGIVVSNEVGASNQVPFVFTLYE